MSEPGRQAPQSATDGRPAPPGGAAVGDIDADADVTVLHVDDEPAVGDLVSRFLEDGAGDLTVLTETDAEAALERVAAGAVDCVVSDYEMPGMDGLAFGRAMALAHPSVPFVLFSGRHRSEVLGETDAVPVDGFVRKSGGRRGFEALAERVREVTGRAQPGAERT